MLRSIIAHDRLRKPLTGPAGAKSFGVGFDSGWVPAFRGPSLKNGP